MKWSILQKSLGKFTPKKKFYEIDSWSQIDNIFYSYLTILPNNLECLSLVMYQPCVL
jgi:hypothetical protein